MSRPTAYFKNRWIIAAILAVPIVLLSNLKLAPQLIERFYSEGFYKGISYLLHLLIGWLPFSIGDVLYILAIIWLLYAVIKIIYLLAKRRFKLAGWLLLKLVIGVETGVIVFYVFWGLNYFRPSAAERLGLQDTSYTIKDVEAVTRMIIDSANASRDAVTKTDVLQPNQSVYASATGAIKILSATSPVFHICMPGVKPSMLSPLMNYLSTSGYYNPFTGEAQINWQMPVFDRPFTACHEMGHQMGFGREDEANFVGYLAGIHSNDRLLKYSAYYEASIEFLRYIRRRDTVMHHQLKALLNPGVRQDLKTDSTYWINYAGQIGLISGKFYDSFLKANNQPAGLRTYNRMIRLTMAWYLKKSVNHSR